MKSLIVLITLISTSFAQVSDKRFQQIIENVRLLYWDRIDTLPIGVFIDYNWESNVENAYVHSPITLEDESATPISRMEFSGAWVRSPEAYHDSVVALVCHEFGHLLGGAPRLRRDNFENPNAVSYFSAEGQADYFAAASCMKKYFATFPEQNAEGATPLFPLPLRQLTSVCESNTETPEHFDLCMRISLAAAQLFKNYHHLNESNLPITVYPVPRGAHLTIRNGYPSERCRLWTYINGALCTDSPDIRFDPFDQTQSPCGTSENYRHKRPNCWFRANDNDDLSMNYGGE